MTKQSSKKTSQASRSTSNKLLANNRLARHQYEIFETLETGIQLLGTEVKSIRSGKSNLRDGFCLIRNGEIQLYNVHISPHNHAGKYFNHDPLRIRKLLAHKKEIEKLKVSLEQKGLTLIPLTLYLKGSWIKLTIGLCKGRKLHDKRQEERRKQDIKDMRSALSRF
uniref:SsrA-binding protein n=1 Tax=Paulinella micropora TaxID=1928728 RepID=A0A385I0E3_9EUKA|nr:SsrA-binding protein [Paulinella micropora]AXY63403.1 SsrA-binding protein [Paulinella micropora]